MLRTARPTTRTRGGHGRVAPDEIGTESRPAPGYLYQQIADDIQAKIESGELAAGDKLPGEAAMAAEYGVARLTARAAVRELRVWGSVVTLPSKGTFIR